MPSQSAVVSRKQYFYHLISALTVKKKTCLDMSATPPTVETSNICANDCFRDEKNFRDENFFGSEKKFFDHSPRHLHLRYRGNSSTELIGRPVIVYQDQNLFHRLCTHTINPEYQTFFQVRYYIQST